MLMKAQVSFKPDYVNNEWVVFLKTENKRKKISGHRFVELLGMSAYAHPISTLLGSFGLWEIDDNVYMEAGRLWEKRILDAVANPGYEIFTYEKYKGDCFNDPVFGGLMDAYDPKLKIIWEAKLYHWKLNDDKKATWFQQLALYWKLWSDMHPGEEIDAGIAYLRKPKSDDSFKESDVVAEQLPNAFKKDILEKMKKAVAAYEKLTASNDGVMIARSPMTAKVAEDIEWFKKKYIDLVV